jgi:hypothetical protein
MLTATIRPAETRAKARALSDAVNVGVAALEELGEEHAEEASAPARRVAATHPLPNGVTTDVATPAQLRALGTLARERGIDPARAGVDVDHLGKSRAASPIERWQKGPVAPSG